ncbi:MAG: sulfite reductase subunit alpha [Rhodospirillales bacterium]|nr:sulfite reductase subunit alpha [Rhodospirillales bacterium]
MNAFVPPTIPENAPFSTEQRAWLNGFLAGFLNIRDLRDLDAVAREIGLMASIEARSDVSISPPTENLEDDGAPWHDPALGLDDRMKLAAGRPLRRRLMAAMGQLDCGQCGYDCHNYAEALFTGKEAALNLCQPGGKPTSRMLKALIEEATVEAPAPATDLKSKLKTFVAKFMGATPLTAPDSDKDVRHIEIDLSESGLTYEVGDSLGIVPENWPDVADGVIAALGVTAETTLSDGRVLRDVLLKEVSLGVPPDALFDLLGIAPTEELEQLDVLGLLERFPDKRPAPDAFIAALDKLNARLYSISSSPKAAPGKVNLTVSAVRYAMDGRLRKGVASTFLADRLEPGSAITVYVQKAHNFALPADDTRPIVMVGPGTGIAPFRAFLQERKARGVHGKSCGDSWLFFGDQHEASDFLYKDELKALLDLGVLTRMNTAFSRDQAEKIYVQHRMDEEGEALWRWLQDGAYFYVCGDAGRMAADVDEALHRVIEIHGKMKKAEAKDYVAAMKKDGRYQRDVY